MSDLIKMQHHGYVLAATSICHLEYPSSTRLGWNLLDLSDLGIRGIPRAGIMGLDCFKASHSATPIPILPAVPCEIDE